MSRRAHYHIEMWCDPVGPYLRKHAGFVRISPPAPAHMYYKDARAWTHRGLERKLRRYAKRVNKI